MAKIIIYRDSKDEWRWRVVAANGRVLADSAEGYDSKHNVERALDRDLELLRAPVTFWEADANGTLTPFWTSKS